MRRAGCTALRVFALVAACALGACDAPASSPGSGPVDECTKAGQRCTLGGAQLGVCVVNDSMALVCASQH
ncbi:MAG: hypothetical protein AAGI01_01505 [Myxococcota bacterium]